MLFSIITWLTLLGVLFRMKSVFRLETARQTRIALESWTAKYYPGRMKWLFASFVLCFLYLAGSGFFFSLFIASGIYGLPLVGHVILGGVFAVLQAALLLWRARDYRFDKPEEAVFARFAGPLFKNVSKDFVRKLLFWAIAFFGLLLILTALFSMLTILPADAQGTLILIHKYSALAVLLAVLVFIDITFIPAPRP